jgi:hypothetical protein
MTEQNNKTTYDDWKSDIDEWADMWDEMQENKSHPPAAPKAEIAVWDEHENNPHDIYYSYVNELAHQERDNKNQPQPYAGHIQQVQDGLLQEQDDRTPNPVFPDSVGPDHETTPPVWTSEHILSEIKGLKDKIFDLENDLAKLGQKDQWQEKVVPQTTPTPISVELERLRDEIEKVSSRLGVEHEPSPYVVKRI